MHNLKVPTHITIFAYVYIFQAEFILIAQIFHQRNYKSLFWDLEKMNVILEPWARFKYYLFGSFATKQWKGRVITPNGIAQEMTSLHFYEYISA